MRRSGSIGFLVLLLCLLTQDVQAGSAKKPGAVKMKFDGLVHALVPEQDGGLLVGGAFTKYRNTPVPSLVRIKPDGSLDQTFGTMKKALKGTVISAALLGNGKIIVTGNELRAGRAEPADVLRLNRDGSLDPGLQYKGYSMSERSRVLVLPGDEIILLTHQNLFRLLDNGSTLPLSSDDQEAIAAVVATRDGKLVVAIEQAAGWMLERWTADGRRDRSFMSASLSFLKPPEELILPSHRMMPHDPPRPRMILAIQEDGKLLVGRDQGEAVSIIRLMPDGSVDKRFNRVPKVLPPDDLESLHKDYIEVSRGDDPDPDRELFTENWRFERFAQPAVVAMAPDSKGRIIIALEDGHVLRLEHDGSLDHKYHLRVSNDRQIGEDAVIGIVEMLLPGMDDSVWILHGDSYTSELSFADKNGKIVQPRSGRK